MTNKALSTILPIVGWDDKRQNEVEITGGLDPVLPTPFRITETSTAALSAVALAVSDLWELRTGRKQGIRIDPRRATASLRSGKYIKLNGTVVSDAPNTIMGFYPAKNGRWSYVHCNFPNHRAAALKVLGAEENRESVGKAVAKWDAQELEEAIIAAKGAGGMVRTIDEWKAHPQGIAVSKLPLFEIIKIGDSKPEPLPKGDRPLSGIRVLDLTRVIAGPTCARTLAEQGADVMKISAAHLPSLGRQEYDTGHGKLSAYVDLREEKEKELLRGLVKSADIFSQGYRPGTLGARGFSPEELAKMRPGIIAVSLCAFGHEGPWKDRRGFDTVIQSVSGIAHRQGQLFPGPVAGSPMFYPVSAIDFLTGYLMAFGAMVALKRRAQEGGSYFVRTSLAQIGWWLLSFGQLSESQLKNVPTNLTPEEIERWSITTDMPDGKLTHLSPTIEFSETKARWVRPAVPLGYHRPVWPAIAEG